MLTDAVLLDIVCGKLYYRGYWISRLQPKTVAATNSLWLRTEWVYYGKRQVLLPFPSLSKRKCCCASKKVYFFIAAVCKAKFSHDMPYFMHKFLHICNGDDLPYGSQYVHESGTLERWLFVSQETARAVYSQGEECGKTAESLILSLSNTKSQDSDGGY